MRLWLFVAIVILFVAMVIFVLLVKLRLCVRIRLRKKTWRSPGTVYTDHQVFERDIHVFANYEMFVEPLQGQLGHWRGGTW